VDAGVTIIYNENNFGGYSGNIPAGAITKHPILKGRLTFSGTNKYYDNYFITNKIADEFNRELNQMIERLIMPTRSSFEQYKDIRLDNYTAFATMLACGTHTFIPPKSYADELWRTEMFYRSDVKCPDGTLDNMNAELSLLGNYIKIWQYVFNTCGFTFNFEHLDNPGLEKNIKTFAEMFGVTDLIDAYNNGIPVSDLCVG
jgi:hypothetical protein